MLGFISNQITSAIIDGTSIVWFPVPKFDSPSIFSKLLDERGGEFTILPGDITSLSQEYEIPMILTTHVETDQGKMTITDLIPVGETIIIRKVESDFPFRVKFDPIFNYGLYRPVPDGNRRINPRGRDCVAFIYEYEGDVIPETENVWKFSMGKGYLIINYSSDLKHGPMSERTTTLSLDFSRPFQKTIEYWKRKIITTGKRKFSQIHETSLAVLLGSIYAPSGGSIASPTTSLPEVVGGSRNWDYRFVWVRDSSIAAEALLDAGYVVEARSIIRFLLSLVNFSSKPFFYPLYTVEGTIPPPERKLRWLSGFRNSRPVRIGNAASTQIQLDVEGFFMSSLHKYFEMTKDNVFVNDVYERLRYIADWEAENWNLKDSGIWEDRGDPQHYIHSKIMMWIAMDKAGRISRSLGLPDPWRDSRKKLYTWIMENSPGYFPRYQGSKDIDASILSAPLYGFVDVNDETFRKTLSRVEKELVKEGFVKRYSSDFMGEAKHPFLLTTLWLARVYIRLGDVRKAMNIVEKLDKVAGSLHLLGEHFDVTSNEFTGNFPQVFVHAQMVTTLKELESSWP